MSERPLLEVCVGSVSDALAAAEAGADRIELCSALELGGLTPSIGVAERVIDVVTIPVVVMLRPRAGGFAYSDAEFDCLLSDAERLLAAGAKGIVFGVLTPAGLVDTQRVERLVALAGAAQTVFHKAFDAIADRSDALETLIDLGVQRVLTSGGAPTAIEGAESLRSLNQQAAGRIEILPGGGVAAEAATDLLAQTGCRSLHAGATVGRLDTSVTPEQSAAYCDFQRLLSGAYRAVDAEAVRRLINQLRGA